MRFMMGFSESYDQARSQISWLALHLVSPKFTPWESRRTMASISMVGQGTEVVALLVGK